MRIEEAFSRFINQEVILYTMSHGGDGASAIECTVKETGDGWILISQGDGSQSIVNVQNIIRIREYPRNRNGRKKNMLGMLYE